MVPWRFELAAIAVIFLILSPRSAAWAERDWAITLYSGRLTDSELGGSATWDFEFENSYVMDVGLSRRVYRFHDYFDAEIEGQVAEHYDETSQLLGALMFEFAFSLPKVPQWSIAGGIHHRSGAGGTFGGVRGASNAWVVGLRYSF